ELLLCLIVGCAAGDRALEQLRLTCLRLFRLCQCCLGAGEVGLRSSQRVLLVLRVEASHQAPERNPLTDGYRSLDHLPINAEAETGLLLRLDLADEDQWLGDGTVLDRYGADRPGLRGRRRRLVTGGKPYRCRPDDQEGLHVHRVPRKSRLSVEAPAPRRSI